MFIYVVVHVLLIYIWKETAQEEAFRDKLSQEEDLTRRIELQSMFDKVGQPAFYAHINLNPVYADESSVFRIFDVVITTMCYYGFLSRLIGKAGTKIN